MSTLVSKHEIAAEWGVTPVTVSRWRKRGIIPCVAVGSRVVRYDAVAVREALVRQFGHPATVTKETK